MKILQNLDKKTRAECRLVCKDFNSLMSNDVTFKDDQCLVIKYRYLHENHPIVTIFSESQTSYKKLILKGVEIDPNANLENFWIRLGKSVKRLVLINCDISKFLKNLQYFEKLEDIRFCKQITWNEFEPSCSNALSTLTNIKSLMISQRGWGFKGDWLEILLTNMPNLESIEVYNQDQEILKILEKYADKVRGINIMMPLPDLTLHKNFTQLEHINFINVDREDYKIDKIIDFYPILKSYSIGPTWFPYTRENLINELNLYFTENLEFMSSLKNFVQLKRLSISLSLRHFGQTSICFFGHEVIDLKLNYFNLKILNKEAPCHECLIALAKSIKRAKRINVEIIKPEQFKLMASNNPNIFKPHSNKNVKIRKIFHYEDSPPLAKNWSFLTHVSFDNFADCIEEKLLQELLYSIKKHLPNLKKLCFGMIKLNEQLFINIRNCLPPTMEIIKFDVMFGINVENIIHTCNEFVNVFNKFPKLTKFGPKQLKYEKVIQRKDIEKFRVLNSNDIGPSMHMWDLIEKLFSHYNSLRFEGWC